ncbi:MAG: D-alanyl-D-alanine carboxypeptidase family protein [Pseudomonadota bacterium]
MTFQASRGRTLAFLVVLGIFLASAPLVRAAQYAALVMDARDGTVLHSRNADTRLHPASLTKMMTLYLVFDAIEKGRLSLDQQIKISRYAASKPPSKLGLKAGQTIALRYLVRASAVKSANDAAAALAEAISGSEPAFAKKMTATARAMGMSKTTFKNASGLTQSGHLSTARDMALLGRRLFYDFPEYYNLFSRTSTSAKVKTVYNTNRRLLAAYQGADGIKTGYTRAAGFNLVSSARRGQKRVIVSMFGGQTSASRNARVAELMDMGFSRMPPQKGIRKPGRFVMPADGGTLVARANTRLKTAQRPRTRPRLTASVAAVESAASQIVAEVAKSLAVEEVAGAPTSAPVQPVPQARIPVSTRPLRRSAASVAVAVAAVPPPATQPVRQNNEGQWVVQLGGTHNRTNGERLLLQTALQEMEALEGSKRVMQPTASPGWFRASFVGLSEDAALAACARLAARQTPCQVMQGS